MVIVHAKSIRPSYRSMLQIKWILIP